MMKLFQIYWLCIILQFISEIKQNPALQNVVKLITHSLLRSTTECTCLHHLKNNILTPFPNFRRIRELIQSNALKWTLGQKCKKFWQYLTYTEVFSQSTTTWQYISLLSVLMCNIKKHTSACFITNLTWKVISWSFIERHNVQVQDSTRQLKWKSEWQWYFVLYIFSIFSQVMLLTKKILKPKSCLNRSKREEK